MYESERRSSAFENITPSLVIHYSWSVEFKCKLALGLVAASLSHHHYDHRLLTIVRVISRCLKSIRSVSSFSSSHIFTLYRLACAKDTICALRYYLYDHCWHQAKLTNFFKQFEMSRAARHDKWDDLREVCRMAQKFALFGPWHRYYPHWKFIRIKINRIKLRGKRVHLFHMKMRIQ